MPFLLNTVICTSMAVSAPCQTGNPEGGTLYPTREACEELAYIYNNEQFHRTEEKLDAEGRSLKTWTYYCRAVTS